jgi:hypothetical protein
MGAAPGAPVLVAAVAVAPALATFGVNHPRVRRTPAPAAADG